MLLFRLSFLQNMDSTCEDVRGGWHAEMGHGRALRRHELQNSHLIAKRQMWLYAFLFKSRRLRFGTSEIQL
jgi:hypothetical protein